MEFEDICKQFIKAENMQIEACNERIIAWRELAKTVGMNRVESTELLLPTFRSKVEAFKYVLRTHPEGLHIIELKNALALLNISVDLKSASGILRRYVADGKYFDALGKNRFKLREEFLTENK